MNYVSSKCGKTFDKNKRSSSTKIYIIWCVLAAAVSLKCYLLIGSLVDKFQQNQSPRFAFLFFVDFAHRVSSQALSTFIRQRTRKFNGTGSGNISVIGNFTGKWGKYDNYNGGGPSSCVLVEVAKDSTKYPDRSLSVC